MINRSFRHWTPRYLRDRLVQKMWERSNPDAPWLTRTMIEILDIWLRPDDVGLEFGSGRSTIWFAKRVRHLTSVEHNPTWYDLIQNRLALGGGNVDYCLHEDGATQSATSAYVNVTREITDFSLDFCLIDGKARDYCALACLNKLKPGGILIIDDIHLYIPREKPSSAPGSRCLQDGYASDVWQQVGEQFANWRCIWTTDGVSDTAFWVKPY